jgi:cation:H+ antiporter
MSVLFLFILSLFGIYFSGELVIKNIIRLAHFLKINVFVISFFLIGIASALPNLFLGISSAFEKIPELSLGDVFGNNFLNLTLVIVLAILFSKTKKIEVQSSLIRQSFVFMTISALAPLFLASDGVISRYDGLFLLILFAFYIWWSFSSRDYIYEEVYKKTISIEKILKEWEGYKAVLKIILGLVILFLSAQGVIFSSKYFANYLNLPLIMIGILIVGFSDALPEIYFAFSSARKGETQMIFGDIIGSVIASALLILGIVSLIQPIFIENFKFLEINRLLYMLVILFLLWFVEKDKELNLRHAFILLGIYILFLIFYFL